MKLLLTTFLFFLFLPISHSQKTYIPDNGFEEALIFAGLDNVLDDSITTSIIDTLTFLNLEPFGIIDLTGIEDFTALEVLACVNNNIQQIDLTNNSNIEILNCENNNVTSIDVTNCPNLIQLIAEDNSLTGIDVTQNPSLETLNLGQNTIGTISLASNLALKTLILANTGLSSIDLTSNWLLEQLDVTNNQLTTLDLTYAPNLFTLVSVENSISQLDLSNNPNLISLLISNNNITQLDLQNNPLLTAIICSNNELASLTLPTVDINSTAILATLNNPNLNCVQCDNPTYVNANWTLSIATFTVISDMCTSGINEFETEVDIFPNPTENGWITIKTESNGFYQLFDLNGAQLQNGKINGENNLLDFSSFTTGMYLLQLKLNDQFITRRIEIF
jgi:hypothetical protein